MLFLALEPPSSMERKGRICWRSRAILARFSNFLISSDSAPDLQRERLVGIGARFENRARIAGVVVSGSRDLVW
jgi:hypothetical protein